MGINVRPEERLSKGKKFLSLVILGAVIVLFASCYAKTMDDVELKYCSGQYNTPECRKDRDARNAANYARKKAEQH